ncbi:MAG: FGGY-family carbohydrate kinase [Erysipelotrichaceae bacterium]
MKYYMGIDVGTNQSKGVLVDENAVVIEIAIRSHSIENPKPGYFEMDAMIWWEELCSLSNELLNKSKVNKEAIDVLGISAMGCDCLSVDEQGKPLMKAILYGIDHRAVNEINYLNEYYGDQAKAVFLHDLCSSDVAPKILWIKNNLPEVYQNTYKFLTASSFLTYKLTGKYVIDRYLAEDFVPFYDLKNNHIDKDNCNLFIKDSHMADLSSATDIVGTITDEGSRLMGLSSHTRVICGTGDSGAEAISTGVFNSGDLMVQLGSSCYFVYLCDQLIQEDRLWPSTFIIPDTFSILGGTNTAGTLTKWYRDQLYFDEKNKEMDAFTYMANDVNKIAAGSDGLITLPYFAGERTPINDEDASGLIFGLKLHHTRSHLYRSALEGIAFSIAQHIEILEEHHLPIKKIMLVGGGTQNDAWLHIIADVLQKVVGVCEVSFGASYGDALLAMVASGRYTWKELEEVVKPQRMIQPNQDNQAIYKKYRIIYDKLYQDNKKAMKLL